MSLYVGVDAGGTKTRTVAVSGDGALRLDVTMGPCDLPAHGPEQVRRVLDEVNEAIRSVAVHGAGSEAGVGGASEAGARGAPKPGAGAGSEAAVGTRSGAPAAEGPGASAAEDPEVSVALGLPALGESEAWDEQLKEIAGAALGSWTLSLNNDVRLALEGALPGEPGVLVLSGTGSMAWGKAADGREARAGGWGPLLGDEGSGYDIGRRGLVAVAFALDGRGPATALSEALPKALGVSDLGACLALLGDLPQPPRTAVAGLARTLMQVAADGDDVARAIVETAATDLAAHVEAIMLRLNLPPSCPVSYAGGCFGSAFLRQAFDAALGCAGFAPARQPVTSPAFGGALLAGLPLDRLPRDPMR